MRAGCSMRLSTPPRLSASFQTFVSATSRDRVLLGGREERDHPAEVLHLARGDLVAGMGGEPGVEDPLDRVVAVQPGGDRRAFSQWRSMRTARVFSAAQDEPAVERPGDGAERLLQEAQALGDRRVVRRRRSRR